ncbi:methyltransferase domain protein [Ceratobasidium sp. AG-Ba]|nr:methyltransferase domain protein [Ceratobasidium sp. AG-Ba]
MGGLYPESYAKVVQDQLSNRGEPISVADFGSGAGDWVVGMANEFPHAQIIGFDLVPLCPLNAPSNARFETKDLNKDMSKYRGKFDMIQARSMASGIIDYVSFLRKALCCLKPGGIYMDLNVLLFLYDEDLNPIKPAAGFAKLSYETLNVRCQFPNGVKSENWSTHLESWIREESDFINIQVDDFYIPTGWKGSERYCQQPELSGDMMRENMKEIANAWRPVLLSHGVSEIQANAWVKDAEKELEVPGKLRAYVRWKAVCLVKE